MKASLYVRELTRERNDLRDRIGEALAIEPEDHATRSRDYGRGFADAISRVRAALTAPTNEETTRG